MTQPTCPVCGFPGLEEPPLDSTGEPSYVICPCCGTQFGVDDLSRSHAELRTEWLAEGGAWWSEVVAAPAGWSAEAQLAAAGFPASAVASASAPGPTGG